MPENLVMTSAYVVRPSAHTLGVGVKIFNRVGKRVLDIYAAFRFGAILTIQGKPKELLE